MKENARNKFGLKPITTKVLAYRGYQTTQQIESFLNPSLDDLINATNLARIDDVYETINESIMFNDTICIYSDYDVDGITSGAILYKTLKKLGVKNVHTYVSDRYTDGYGLSKKALDFIAKEYKPQLLITVDCGISNHEEINYAKEIGIETIVVDHHDYEKKETLPNCLFLNPKVHDFYPFKKLSGCGVTWKLCQELTGEKLYEYLDIVALSTVADVVDLIGENRIIVKEGLKRLNSTDNIGLKALIKEKELQNKKITTGDVGFKIAPCINATGRLGKADIAMELLITADKKRAKEIAKILNEYNETRKIEQEKALIEAEKYINHVDNIIIVEIEAKAGILGIIAGRLRDKYRKPAIVLNKDTLTGSCRSMSPLNIYKLLQKNEKYLIKYGGHDMAAGLSVDKNSLQEFKNNLVIHTNNIKYKQIYYEFEIETKDLSLSLVRDLEKLEPFGKGNARPKFKSICDLNSVRVIGKNKKHLQFNFDDDINAVGFNMVGKIRECKSRKLEVIYSPEINSFLGKTILQMNIKDIKGVENS